MTVLTRSQLQKALDALTKANQRAHDARQKVMAHCQEAYGAEPGDVDFDQYIDAVEGGCGKPSGMSAQDFDKGMRELTQSREH